jgi:hypothetical protein
MSLLTRIIHEFGFVSCFRKRSPSLPTSPLFKGGERGGFVCKSPFDKRDTAKPRGIKKAAITPLCIVFIKITSTFILD